MSSFDFGPYVRPPRLDAAGAVLLVARLIGAAPSPLPAPARKALERMRQGASTLQEALRSRKRGATPDVRLLDQAFDTAWRALQLRLIACSMLPREAHPASERAEVLNNAIFPSGLSFLTYDYEPEWHESAGMLARIDGQVLAADLDAICGGEFLAHVRARHAALGAALGLSYDPKAPSPRPEESSELVTQVASAIAAYGRALAAAVDEEQATSIDRFRAAMAPLEAHRAAGMRAAMSGAEGGGDDAEAIAQAIPPLPAG